MKMGVRTCFSPLGDGYGVGAALASALIACSPSTETCGSRTAVVGELDTDRSLMFEKSGLIGGDVIVKGGHSCAAVLDIETKRASGNIGDTYQAMAYTSRHCDLLESQRTIRGDASQAYATDSLTLRIFGAGQYADIDVTTLNPARTPPDSNSFASQSLAAAYDRDFRSFVDDERSACLGRAGKGSVCATLGDMVAFRVLVGKAWGTALGPKFSKVFADALATRELIRQKPRDANGAVLRAADIARSIEELTLLRRDLRFGGPDRIDLGLVCLAPQLRTDLNGGKLFSTGPTALDRPLSGENVRVREWREGILAAWRQMDAGSAQGFCDGLVGETLTWVRTELQTSKILGENADQIEGSVLPLAFAANLLSRYVTLSERMMRAWSDLGVLLASPEGRQNFWVASNLVQPGSDARDRRFVSFSPGRNVLENPSAQVLPSGIRFKSDPQDNAIFRLGNSGSLFTFRGQFPLLALYSVDGKEASGGVAVLPLPSGQTSAEPYPSSEVETSTVGGSGTSDPAGGTHSGRSRADEDGNTPTAGGLNGTAVSMSGGEPPSAPTEGALCR